MAQCQTCDEALLYHQYDVEESGEADPFAEARLVWPDSGNLHYSVPDQIKACYKEAYRIRRLAPGAFAVQIRRALEFLCLDQKAEGQTLGRKIEWLAKQGRIPGELGKMTGAMRLLGNIGAHASDQNVLPSDAFAIDGFFRSLVEYVYVAPHKLKEFEQRLSEMGQRGVTPSMAEAESATTRPRPVKESEEGVSKPD